MIGVRLRGTLTLWVALAGLVSHAEGAELFDLPRGFIELPEPTGTVTPYEDVVVNGQLIIWRTPGFNRNDLPSGVDVATSSGRYYVEDVTGSYLSSGRACSDTFVCNGGPYIDASTSASPYWATFLDNATAVNDTSAPFEVYRFLPASTPVPEGTYRAYDLGFYFTFLGTFVPYMTNDIGLPLHDDQGELILDPAGTVDTLDYRFAGTFCDSEYCWFTRTVEAAPVPLPAAAWLLLSGIGAFGGLACKLPRPRRSST